MAVENLTNIDNQKSLKLKTFYNKYFPRDEYSYRLRMPFVGLILSILSVGLISKTITQYYFIENPVLLFAYVLGAFGLGYELHYGLKTRDHHQFTPWLLLKFLECVVGFVTVLNYMFNHRFYAWDLLFYKCLLIGLNVALTLSMFKKAREYEKLAVPEKQSLQETNE